MNQKQRNIAIGIGGVAVIVIIGLGIGIPVAMRGSSGVSETGLKVIGGPDIKIKSDAYTKQVTEFLNSYQDGSTETISCTEEVRPKKGQVCNFEKAWISRCHDDMACVYLTLSLKGNFTPEAFKDLNDGENLPQQLKDRMEQDFYDYEQKLPERLWLNCEGATLDEIHYAQWTGYPVYYFEQTAAEGYIMPYVVVSFKKPDAQATVECAIYAKNIKPEEDPYYKTSFTVEM